MYTFSVHQLQQRRRLFLILFWGGCASYAVYRVYRLPAIVRARNRTGRFFGALSSVVDAACSTADAIALVSSDLDRFLTSDSDEIPTSLRQISKLARSQELTASLTRVTEAVSTGALRGAQSAFWSAEDPGSPPVPSYFQQAVHELLSDAGARFAATVAESFGKGLVLGFHPSDPNSTGQPASQSSGLEAALPWWVALITGDQFRRVLEGCVHTFVDTAVTIYLDKTLDINTYDDFFTGLTNPRHEAQVKEILATLCNGAVETFIRTMHQVLTSPNTNPPSVRGRGGETSQPPQLQMLEVTEISPASCNLDEGSTSWIDTVSSTLAVPSNRKFVLDVTGRMTFETVRSFLDYVGANLYENGRRGAIAVRTEVVERGREVVKCAGTRSIIILMLCFWVCLYLSYRTRALIPL